MSRERDKRREESPPTNAVEVSLTVGERLRLTQLLPERGPITTARLVRNLMDELSLNEAELRDHEVKQTGEGPELRVTWKHEDRARRFRFAGFELELILSSLRRASEGERLTAVDVPLWDKFIPAAEA